jgi:hypothetical protein
MRKDKKKQKTSKKIVAAFAMFALSASMLGTATYAWFTMNKEVTVTGMEVKTKVGDNLLIAQDELGSTAKKADGDFKTSDIDIMKALLEPVSTVNGTSFWYTDSFNVAGNGDALSDVYTEYNESASLTNNLGGRSNFKTMYDAGFQTNYGITGEITTANVAYGYIDYVFQIKANNTTDSAKDIVVKDISLTSGKVGDTDTLHAFRAAIFAEDITSATPTGGTGTLKTILSSETATTGAYYFTDGMAISTNGAPTAVSKYNSSATIGSATASTTSYFKVVVRLWLEGEDENCTNTVFNTVTDNWALSLDIVMDGTTTAVTKLTTSAPSAKADLSAGPSVTANTKVIDGVTYYEISGVALGSEKLYKTANSAVAAGDVIYTISATNHPTDVTNQCILP